MSLTFRALATLGLMVACPASAGEAAPQVAILDLPFRATAMRGPGSEVTLAVATSGLLPARRQTPASADPAASAAAPPLAIVWGDEAGAALQLADGTIRTTPLGKEAIERLAASETPRGAVSGSHRALSGPLSAFLTGPVRSRTGAVQATSLTIRERQPLGVTTDPRPVPVATATVTPGDETVFAARRPRIAALDGKPIVLAVTARASLLSSELAVLSKADGGAWRFAARSPPQAGKGTEEAPLSLLGVADFDGSGRTQIAALREPDGDGVLQLWILSGDSLVLAQEAAGYAGAGAGEDAELAATFEAERGGAAGLALPVADRNALALVSLRGGIRELARVKLPEPAAFGVAALGRGAGLRFLVGLADGRVAVVMPSLAP